VDAHAERDPFVGGFGARDGGRKRQTERRRTRCQDAAMQFPSGTPSDNARALPISELVYVSGGAICDSGNGFYGMP
jgi:hypothetical protein